MLGLLTFHVLEIGKALPGFIPKGCSRRDHGSDSIEAEAAEIIGRFAPGHQQPNRAEKRDGQRAHRSRRARAVQRLIVDAEHATVLRGSL